MTDVRSLHRALVERVVQGPGQASPDLRRAAFSNAGVPAPLHALVDKVALHAYRVTDDDISAARRAGLSEDQIFEVVICAAVGQSTRQYEAARSALDEATAG